METPITLTQRELLSLSPEVRAQVAEVTIKKRVPRDQSALVMIEEIPDEEEPISRKTEETRDKYKPAAFAVTARTPPDNATIIADPYEVFLRENACATHPVEPVQVAAESNVLRAILPVVDGQDKVEAILDPGCQIVAMSEEVCNALALPYDPTIRLSMVSANGGVNQSLGLARNIPFVVGEITLYLQVHVLRAPAYDILLGRPFDVLTQSVVHNFADENQTVTILDPNTG
jgi:gag-polyprotein putative aspartyl protease